MANTDTASCASGCLSILPSHILPDQWGFSFHFWKSIWSKYIQTWLVCNRSFRNTPKASTQMNKWLKVMRDTMHLSPQTEMCWIYTPEDVFVKQDSSCQDNTITVGHASLIHLWKLGEDCDGANNPKSIPFSPPPPPPHTLCPLSPAGFHPTLTQLPSPVPLELEMLRSL